MEKRFCEKFQVKPPKHLHKPLHQPSLTKYPTPSLKALTTQTLQLKTQNFCKFYPIINLKRLLLLHLQLQQSQFRLLHNPSQGQPSPLWLQKILPLPYLLRHTNGRRLSWRT